MPTTKFDSIKIGDTLGPQEIPLSKEQVRTYARTCGMDVPRFTDDKGARAEGLPGMIAPGNLMFYTGTKTFPQWNGNGFTGGLMSMSLNRIIFDGHGGAKAAERWDVGHRIRDVEEGPDGSLWMLEDANPGALIHVTPQVITSR